MTESPSISVHEPLRLIEKLRFVVACALSAWLFVTVGGMVVQPSDPQAALSLVGNSAVLSRAVSAALLSAVVALLAAVVGPSRLPGFSCVAMAVGWEALNWNGATMEYLLLFAGGAEASSRASLFGRLTVETLYWCVLAAGALMLERVVRRWLGQIPSEPDVAAESKRGASTAAGWRSRLLTISVSAAIGAFVVSQFVARSAVAETHKGQVYFSLLAGFYLGALVGLYFSLRVSPILFVISVGLVASLSYLWAATHPMADVAQAAYRGLLSAPPTALSRPLPVEYVGLGMIGAIAGSWSARNVYVPAGEGSR